jgi:membrane protein required for colicin V production
MGVDIAFIAIAAWYGYKGFRKGVVHVLFSSAAMLLATLGAIKFSGKMAAYLFESNGSTSAWTPILAFTIVFATIMFFVFLVSKTIDASLKKVHLGFLNKTAGAMLYTIMVAVIFSTLLWIGDKVSLISEDLKEASLTYNILAPIAPKTFTFLGYILPFVKDSFNELNAILTNIDQKIPTN